MKEESFLKKGNIIIDFKLKQSQYQKSPLVVEFPKDIGIQDREYTVKFEYKQMIKDQLRLGLEGR